MQITGFGIVWILILGFATLFKDIKFLAKIVIFSCLLQASAVFIVFDTGVVSPLTVSCLFYIISFLIKKNKRIRMQIPLFFKIFILFFLVILLSSSLSSLLFRGMNFLRSVNWIEYKRYEGAFDIASVYRLFELLLRMITVLLMYNSEEFSNKESHKLIETMIIFVFVISFIQVVSLLGIVPYSKLFTKMFFSNFAHFDSNLYLKFSEYGWICNSIMDVRISSSFTEPSYLGAFLGITFYYYISKNKLAKRDILFLVIIIVMCVLSFSSTALITVAFGAILSLVNKKKTKTISKIIIRSSILLIVCIICITALDLWDKVFAITIDKSNSYSGYIRGMWNSSALKVFSDTFMLGLGFDTVRGSSLLFTLLGSLGLLGSIMFFVFIGSIILDPKRRLLTTNDSLFRIDVYSLMLVVELFAQFVALPDLDFPILWMCIVLCVLSKSLNIDMDKRSIDD